MKKKKKTSEKLKLHIPFLSGQLPTLLPPTWGALGRDYHVIIGGCSVVQWFSRRTFGRNTVILQAEFSILYTWESF